MSNDSIGKTLGVAFGLCLICSVVVSTTAVKLRPEQTANKVMDKRKNILQAAGLLEEGKSVEELFRQIEPKLIDLSTGEYLDEDPQNFDARKAAKDSKENWTIPAERDFAGIKTRAQKAPVYLLKNEGKLEGVILPVSGKGLWSTLYGFLALSSDTNTVKGLSFYEHGETPGLGGEVENPKWKALWPGKKVYNENGEVVLHLTKGSVETGTPGSEFKVDGLSGATLTSRGVSQILKFWLGPDGFKPFLEKLRANQTDLAEVKIYE